MQTLPSLRFWSGLALIGLISLTASCSTAPNSTGRKLAEASPQKGWNCSPRTPKDTQTGFPQFVFSFNGTQVSGKALSSFFGPNDPNNDGERLPAWGVLSGDQDGWTWILSPAKASGDTLSFSLSVQLDMDEDDQNYRFVLNTKTSDLWIRSSSTSDEGPGQKTQGHYLCAFAVKGASALNLYK